MLRLQPWQAVKTLFGFNSSGTLADPVQPDGLDSVSKGVFVYGHDPISSWYKDRMQLTTERFQRYKEYEDADADDICVSVFDIWAEDACLAGETKIALVEGKDTPVKDLVDRTFTVYAYDHAAKRIRPARATARPATVRELVAVTIDNGEVIRCTPDHPFMLRDATFVEAGELKPGDSLMPLYKKYATKGLPGYELLYQPVEGKWHYSHRAFVSRPAPTGCDVIHHADLDPKNNTPENLRWMSKKDHCALHMSGHVLSEEARDAIRKSKLGNRNPMKNPATVEKMRQSKIDQYKDPRYMRILSDAGRKGNITKRNWTQERRDQFRQLMRERSKENWQRPEYRSKMVMPDGVCSKGGRSNKGVSLKAKWTDEQYQHYRQALARTITPARRRMINSQISQTKKARALFNHKVVSVQTLSTMEMTYDVSVEGLHNFALACGVFTHNTQVDLSTGRIIWVESEDEATEKICNDLLDRVKADKEAFAIARELAKFGDSFAGVSNERRSDGTPGRILKFLPAPPYALSRLQDEYSRLKGFLVAPIEQLGSALGSGNPFDISQDLPTDPPWSFIHWRLLGKDRFSEYGTSMFAGARRSYRQLRMVEDATVIYRLRKAPDRLLFKLKGLSGLSPEDRRKAMDRVRQEMRKRYMFNRANADIRSEMKPVGFDDDIIVDDESVAVERLAGTLQTNQITDVDYLRKRFFGSLKIPPDYLGFVDSAKGVTVGTSPLCLTGDTKIPLADGRTRTLVELQEEYKDDAGFWVYSCELPNRRIVPGWAHHVRKTGTQTSIIEVGLDNGESVRCTPEHPFLLTSGEYAQAKDLQPGDSLSALYRRESPIHPKYEEVFDYAHDAWLFTSRLFVRDYDKSAFDARGHFVPRNVVHHKNYNSLDNRPENLVMLSSQRHMEFHGANPSPRALELRDRFVKYMRSAEGREESRRNAKLLNGYGFRQYNGSEAHRAAIARRFSKPEEREKMAAVVRKNISSFHEKLKKDPLKHGIGGVWARARNDPVLYERLVAHCRRAGQKGRESARARGMLPFQHKVKAPDVVMNHKVAWIRHAGRADVYDMTVDVFHNFATSAGVFVHNSMQDINFARGVKRLQVALMEGYSLACQIEMCWAGLDPRATSSKFTMHMNPVSMLDEKQRLDLEQTRLDTIEVLQKVGSALGIEGDEWGAYLLQRSGIPAHLLRKSGLGKDSGILKGKMQVLDSTQRTINERLSDWMTTHVDEAKEFAGALVKMRRVFRSDVGPNTISSKLTVDSWGLDNSGKSLLNPSLMKEAATEFASAASKEQRAGVTKLLESKCKDIRRDYEDRESKLEAKLRAAKVSSAAGVSEEGDDICIQVDLSGL